MFSAEITAATPTATRGRDATVDEAAHQVAAAREHHQRDQRERNPEREDDLADHQGPGRVDADRDHDERGHHRDGAAHQERDLPVG